MTVTVRTEIGRDEFNNPVFARDEQEVDNVLVAPGTDSDIIESVRPDGSKIVYTLCFPKTFSGDLECERVNVRGEWLDVVGAPDHYEDSVCPTDWNMIVSVGVVHG